MNVRGIEVGDRTSLYEDGTSVEFYTKLTDEDDNEVDLVWLTPDQFSDEKARQLSSLFEQIMDLIGSEFERYN
jgi:hypothetical protein